MAQEIKVCKQTSFSNFPDPYGKVGGAGESRVRESKGELGRARESWGELRRAGES